MGLPITYIRSSMLSCKKMCELKLVGEYMLGWTGPSNQKADKGTICHKVMEILACAKLGQQNKEKYYIDDITGKVTTNVDKINIDSIIDSVFDYYSKAFNHHDWSDKDLEDCRNWSWGFINYNNGKYDPRKLDIIQPEAQFNFDLPEEWAKYEYQYKGQTLTGTIAAMGTIDLTTKIGNNTYEICDYKGLPLDTPIPTPNGWTTMGEINIGDITFDQYGNQTRVIGKSQVKTKTCYKIRFDDTSEVICDDEHLWSLSDGQVVPINALQVGDKINVTLPMQTDTIDLPIDPYVLGVWLGDGRNRNGEISGQDTFIFDEIERRGYGLGQNIEKRKNTKTISKTVYGLTEKLKKLGLLHSKHIPQLYLRSSIEQRLDLLRGLMDTYGSVNSVRKQGVFTNCNKKLSDSVKELLLSLGQRPYQAHVKTITNFSKGQEIDVYPISFKPLNINPFLLPRKANKIDGSWGYGKSKVRKVVKITKLKKTRQTQCIMVDSEDKTYLCTNNMIPTHNTGAKKCWITRKPKTYDDLLQDIQLRLYYYAAFKIFPELEHLIITIFYVNDGGPVSLFFERSDIPETIERLRTDIQRMQSMESPKLVKYRRDIKPWLKPCGFCPLAKNTFEGTGIKPLYKSDGKAMNQCEQLEFVLKHRPMSSVLEHMTKEGYDPTRYKAPGEVNKDENN